MPVCGPGERRESDSCPQAEITAGKMCWVSALMGEAWKEREEWVIRLVIRKGGRDTGQHRLPGRGHSRVRTKAKTGVGLPELVA